MPEDPSLQFLKEPSTAEFRASLDKVHGEVKAKTGTVNKGGRPVGYRKDPATGKLVKPGDATALQAPEETFVPMIGEISVENCRDLLDTTLLLLGMQVHEKILSRGARVHASVLNNHLPDYMKKYSDIGFLVAWWGVVFSRGSVNNGGQVETEKATSTAPPGFVAKGPTAPASAAPKAGGDAPGRRHNFF